MGQPIEKASLHAILMNEKNVHKMCHEFKLLSRSVMINNIDNNNNDNNNNNKNNIEMEVDVYDVDGMDSYMNNNNYNNDIKAMNIQQAEGNFFFR